MVHNKIHFIRPGCRRPSIALTVQNRGLKYETFIHTHVAVITPIAVAVITPITPIAVITPFAVITVAAVITPVRCCRCCQPKLG